MATQKKSALNNLYADLPPIERLLADYANLRNGESEANTPIRDRMAKDAEEVARDLLAACEALVDDVPYHCDDADTCECGENGDGTDEDGKPCCHRRARAAIAKARGTG